MLFAINSIPQIILTLISNVWWNSGFCFCKTICHVSKHQHQERKWSAMDNSSQRPQDHEQLVQPIRIAKLGGSRAQAGWAHGPTGGASNQTPDTSTPDCHPAVSHRALLSLWWTLTIISPGVVPIFFYFYFYLHVYVCVSICGGGGTWMWVPSKARKEPKIP